MTLGQVSGEIRPDRLDTLVLTFKPLRQKLNSVPYRIDAGNPNGRNPITGAFEFDGTTDTQVQEVAIGDLAKLKVMFYYNAREAGSLEVTRP
ncbi:MAG TPA: hypothetical protein VJI52_01065 [Candidatus Nanoarchaeia archaeon]|nr:hypothetical protein [Candidatus Nanoarchaeia archaeon]